MTNKANLILFGSCLLAATSAMAQKHEIVLEPPVYRTDYVTAEVTRVSPVFEYVTRSRPVQECWDEPVATGHYYSNPVGGSLAGGIVGGVIGHQIGGGHGRDLSTVLGTLIGAQMGHDASLSEHVSVPQYRRVCQTVEQDNGFEVVRDGYQVSYRFDGKDYHARLPYDPGDSLQLKVQVKVE